MKLKNEYEKIEDGLFRWTAYIDNSEQDLDNIESVTYFLHPTFPTRAVVSSNAKDKFRKRFQGWGEFLLQAEIKMKNGTKRHAALWIDLGFQEPDVSALKKKYTGVFKTPNEWIPIKEEIRKQQIDQY